MFVSMFLIHICGNFHELLLGSGLGNTVGLFHMVCQSTLFKIGFDIFVILVLLFRLDIHLCNFNQFFFSEKKLTP